MIEVLTRAAFWDQGSRELRKLTNYYFNYGVKINGRVKND